MQVRHPAADTVLVALSAPAQEMLQLHALRQSATERHGGRLVRNTADTELRQGSAAAACFAASWHLALTLRVPGEHQLVAHHWQVLHAGAVGMDRLLWAVAVFAPSDPSRVLVSVPAHQQTHADWRHWRGAKAAATAGSAGIVFASALDVALALDAAAAAAPAMPVAAAPAAACTSAATPADGPPAAACAHVQEQPSLELDACLPCLTERRLETMCTAHTEPPPLEWRDQLAAAVRTRAAHLAAAGAHASACGQMAPVHVVCESVAQQAERLRAARHASAIARGLQSFVQAVAAGSVTLTAAPAWRWWTIPLAAQALPGAQRA